jgi:hypothetical protein
MALEESDREDLLREATALVERAELTLPGKDEPWIVGFRRDGCGSLYAGQNTALHFNSAHELRRAYWQAQLIKAERGSLFVVERIRAAGRVTLKSTPLAHGELATFQRTVAKTLAELLTALESHTARWVGQVPADADLAPRIQHWLNQVGSGDRIARAPHAH